MDYVKYYQGDLKYQTSEDLCIRLGDESDFSVEHYDLPIFSYLYVYAHLKKVIPRSEKEIEKEIIFYIYKKIIRIEDNSEYGPGFNFTDFPELRKAVWALGQLKMPNVALKILECQEYILTNKENNTYRESFRLARKWIEEVWEIDDKQFLEDFVATYKEQDLAEYLALYEFSPDNYDSTENDPFSEF